MIRLFAILSVLAFAPFQPLLANEGVTITVTVTNLPAGQGHLLVGLYDSADSFTARPLPRSPKIPLSSKANVVAKIPNVKPGRYAIAVIQDLNGNGKLDRNLVGMPTEPLGFSVIKRIPKGKPDFAACSFEVGEKDLALRIALTTK